MFPRLFKTLAIATCITGVVSCTTTSGESVENFSDVLKTSPFKSLKMLLKTSEEKRELREARAKGYALTHPERAADLRKTFSKVYKNTTARKYSDNRVRINSDGALIGSNDKSELDFFVRAAAETLNAGYDGFVVVHLDYFKPGPQLFALTPNMNLSSDRWIGTYENFLRHRNEQNIFSTRSGMNRKVRHGVILMIKSDEFPNRDRFNAADMYVNLMEARYAL